MEILNVTKTVKGYEVKDLKWNSAINAYLGLVADPVWKSPTRDYISCSWNKDGKCFNRNRPDCDLLIEEKPVKKNKTKKGQKK